MQEKRHDRVVEMRLCFFSGKVGDYKMLFVATRKCRSTVYGTWINAMSRIGTITLDLRKARDVPGE